MYVIRILDQVDISHTSISAQVVGCQLAIYLLQSIIEGLQCVRSVRRLTCVLGDGRILRVTVGQGWGECR